MHFMLMKNIDLLYLRCLEVIAVMHGAAPAEARYKVSGVGEAVAAESASCSSSDAILHSIFSRRIHYMQFRWPRALLFVQLILDNVLCCGAGTCINQCNLS